MQPFQPSGKTYTFTANTTAPTAVQPQSETNVRTTQLLITNMDDDTDVYVSVSAVSSSDAIAKAVVPDSTPRDVTVVLARTQVVLTIPANKAYVTACTAANTAVVMVQPGYGV